MLKKATDEGDVTAQTNLAALEGENLHLTRRFHG